MEEQEKKNKAKTML